MKNLLEHLKIAAFKIYRICLTWVKRDADTGQFMDQKSDGTPFKGVAKEPDGRRK